MTGTYSKHLGQWVVKVPGNVLPGGSVMVKTVKGRTFPVYVDKVLWTIEGITTFIPRAGIKQRKFK